MLTEKLVHVAKDVLEVFGRILTHIFLYPRQQKKRIFSTALFIPTILISIPQSIVDFNNIIPND